MPIEERLRGAGLPPLPRPAWLEVDTEALAANLQTVRAVAPPGSGLMAVVKADGYGHGLEVAGRTFAAAGAERLAVATFDEAVRLRAALPDGPPIVVLFAVPLEALAQAAGARIELAASDAGWLAEALPRWAEVRAGPGAELRLHLEVETGFLRAGLRPTAVAAAAGAITATPGVALAGLWTHLADPADEQVTAAQLACFREAEARLPQAGLSLPGSHVAASGGIFVGAAAGTRSVRPGLALYGSLPADLPLSGAAAAAAARLRPALGLKARPVRVEEVASGERVGYGGTWRADRPSRVATLPLGYGDGWSRALSGRASALVRGRRVPLVGVVAMDAVAADVTDVEPPVTRADEFVLLGQQGGERIRPEELAQARTTIAWEVLAGMAARIPRVYHAGPGPTGLRVQGSEVFGGGTRG
ncbi:MAG TPA: alanine racemase [Candidatus Limnocylindrales bacterium]|nr:alanine racemase [Candidatus Limnocylindrales bacterium]